MKKILIILFSIIVSLGLAFTITWGVINFNKVKDGMSGTGLYTETDLNKAHTDGYNQGIKDKAQYLVLIEEYRNTIAMLNDTVSQLTFQVNTLTSTNKDYETKIESLTAQKTTLENKVAELELDKENNEATIYKLNNQIINLNKQINDLSVLTQTASSQITALNNRVNELQSSVNYYESFIAQMENGEQVVATYEVDGTVWKIEILNKGSEITFTSPANTETAIFNGWQIDGTDELLGNTYTINENTKFVADITYKHQVTFMVDEQVYDNQYVIENEFATVPDAPTKDGYVFMGWALNRVDVVEDINTTAVNETTTYYAVFAKIHTVTFMVDEQVYSNQSVLESKFAVEPENPVKDGYVFIGWSLNGVDVVEGITTMAVSGETTFFAIFVESNTWVVTSFNGLTSFHARRVWTDGENTYYSSDAEQYVFEPETRTWTPIEWQGLNSFYGNDIWTDGENIYCSSMNVVDMKYYTYILNKETKTWSSVTFNGFEPKTGRDIFFDGVDCYMLNTTKGYMYKLNKENREWVRITSGLNEILYGTYVWISGDNVYYSNGYNHYVLDKTTDKWLPQVWKGMNNFVGSYIWECNGVFYYSNNGINYVLRK